MKDCRIIGFTLALFALAACAKADRDEQGVDNSREVERVPVSFALSLGGGSTGTKADVNKLKELSENPGFRGLSAVRVIPFSLTGSDVSITKNDEARDWVHNLPAILGTEDFYASTDGYAYHQGLIRGNNAHLYSGADANLPLGTTHTLIYAYPANEVPSSSSTEQEIKHVNGSIVEAGLVNGKLISPSEITFSPDPIFRGTIPAAAQTIADALNTIAKAASFTQIYYYKRNDVLYSSSVPVNWSDIGSTELSDCFKEFTNSGDLTTGAGENVNYLIANLYSKLQSYQSINTTSYKHIIGTEEYEAFLEESCTQPLTYAFLYNSMRDKLLERIEGLVNAGIISTATNGSVSFVDADVNSYPVSLGLPTGSAIVRWDGNMFKVITEAIDGIAPIGRFCYMPSLYFYTNSSIKTTSEKEIYKQYRYVDDNTNWASILSQYRTSNKVSKFTASVAVVEPLQYACGMLVVTLKAGAQMLPDNDNNALTYCLAQGTNFPVTGIIVGGQYRQKFDFTPDAATTEYYMYDNQMPKDDNDDPQIFLTTEKSAEIRTLVFPTIIDSDVYFFLEFRNDSGKSFYGAEGIIMPGSHFYLAGKLEKPSDENKDAGLTSVIMPDHFTTVNCVVSTMENAHISVPELGNPQLALGIQTETSWINSAASYIVLD